MEINQFVAMVIFCMLFVVHFCIICCRYCNRRIEIYEPVPHLSHYQIYVIDLNRSSGQSASQAQLTEGEDLSEDKVSESPPSYESPPAYAACTEHKT